MEGPETSNPAKTYIAPLLAGAGSAAIVCSALYPIDTLKTRMQSQHGFYKSGGFKGVYRGLLTVATGSMPITAVFFVPYEAIKIIAGPVCPSQYAPFLHMFAASISQVLSCIIQVPVDIAKLRKQTYMGSEKRSTVRILLEAYRTEGFRKGLFRGFFSTVARDLPFSFIQFPIWEGLKSLVKEQNDDKINGLQSAVCGAVAGGVAGAVTTPIDLARTRLMLAESTVSARELRIGPVLTTIYLQYGFRGLFVGVTPRIANISLGAFMFFGIYEDVKMFFESNLESNSVDRR